LVLYPNPVKGTDQVTVLPPTFSGVSDVRIQVFTLAFRKVLDNTNRGMVSGQGIPIPLVDSYNDPLANGLYYVVVTTNEGRKIGKLIVLR
jgi:hypothetical protein